MTIFYACVCVLERKPKQKQLIVNFLIKLCNKKIRFNARFSKALDDDDVK